MSGAETYSRRAVMKSAAATLIVAAVTPAGLVIGRGNAWSAQAETLDPNTFATLVQMSRDIYPHQKVEERFYAAAVTGLDQGAKTDAALNTLLTEGVTALDAAAKSANSSAYAAIADENARMVLLEAIKTTPFFQKVRGNLVTGLYNNKEVWPIFGYEGESASKGGYLNRGFDDIAWL